MSEYGSTKFCFTIA